MKLDQLNEAVNALNIASGIPLEPRLRLGLVYAEAAVLQLRSAAFTAAQAKVDGTFDDEMKQEILEQIWNELIEQP